METTVKSPKAEIDSYLKKVAKHVYAFPDGKLYAVIIKDDSVAVYDERYEKIYNINHIDSIVEHYGKNAMCVIKHRLFLNKHLKAVRQTKAVREKMLLLNVGH
jgi:hypothetical protein